MQKSFILVVNVLVWYSTSVVCAVLSKRLLRDGISSDVLTFFQLGFGCAIARAALLIRGTKVYHLSHQMRGYMISLAVTFALGFKTLNAGLSAMAVAFCMTLRVAEPIFTWVISKVLALLSISSHPSNSLLVPILVIVVGAVLAVWKSAEVNTFGLFAIFISNTCFASRSIITKRVQKEQNMDPFLMFYHICKFGVLLQLTYLVGFSFLFGTPSLPHLNLYLLANGVIWYLYLQFSTIVNFLVNAITHTTLNAMRQTIVITASAVVMGVKLSVVNEVGIGLACFGSILYAYFKKYDRPFCYGYRVVGGSEVDLEVELGDMNITHTCCEAEKLSPRLLPGGGTQEDSRG